MIKQITISLVLLVTYLFVLLHNVIPHTHQSNQEEEIVEHHHSHGHHHHHEHSSNSIFDDILMALGDIADTDFGNGHFENYVVSDQGIMPSDLAMNKDLIQAILNDFTTLFYAKEVKRYADPPPLWKVSYLQSFSALRAPPFNS